MSRGQLESIMNQNMSIEEFMGDVVSTIQQHQKKMTELSENVFTVESNNKLFENEIGNIAKDIEKKFDLYKESTAAELLSTINIQRETNKNLEEFTNSTNSKTETIGEIVKKKLVNFEEMIENYEKERKLTNLNNVDDNVKLVEIEGNLKNALEVVKTNSGKTAGLEKKLDNFRNEVNTLFIDYEQSLNERFKEFGNGGVDSVRKNRNGPSGN